MALCRSEEDPGATRPPPTSTARRSGAWARPGLLPRRDMLWDSLFRSVLWTVVGSSSASSRVAAAAFLPPSTSSVTTTSSLAAAAAPTSTTTTTTAATQHSVAYQNVLLPPLDDAFEGIRVPVATWFPLSDNPDELTATKTATVPPTSASTPASYPYRISVRRIGQLLARWDFIPDFVAKDFCLPPQSTTTTTVVEPPPQTQQPLASLAASCDAVVILAHGFLGSRFDLAHLAERLVASTPGRVLCLAPEFPESLAASYPTIDGLTRAVITQHLLDSLSATATSTTTSRPLRYGIVGHSLGCYTALQTGDPTWARVCLAALPWQRDGTPVPGKVLFVGSSADGVMSMARSLPLNRFPSDMTVLTRDDLLDDNNDDTKKKLPPRAVYWFTDDGTAENRNENDPPAPNHISFLAEGVNEAMMDFLSPLLPVARAAGIPVLDFDRYQISRDSVATAQRYQPLVLRYLQQELNL